MPRKIYKPEEIISKLRQVDVLRSQGMSMVDAIRQVGVSEVTFYRWGKEYGGLKADQLKRLKELEKENERLMRAVSDLTPDKLILTKTARSKFKAPLADDIVLALCDRLGVTERRACRVLSQNRSTQRYVPRGRADEECIVDDIEIVARPRCRAQDTVSDLVYNPVS